MGKTTSRRQNKQFKVYVLSLLSILKGKINKLDDIKLRKQVQVIYILKKQVLIKSPKSITTSTFEKQEPI